MVERKNLELLQFDKIRDLVKQRCFSRQAREMCEDIVPQAEKSKVLIELSRVNELKGVISSSGFLPSIEHEDIQTELNYLSLDGALLHESQLLALLKTVEVCNSNVKFYKGKKATLPFLFDLVKDLEVFDIVADELHKIIDAEGQVKDGASTDLARIRKQISEKRRESDK